ncbi:MAG: hypothetical protein GXY58_19195 [Planctomycetaceae bacterium]|nr:hypothetical protein [Planctomycetaceae bacterium]
MMIRTSLLIVAMWASVACGADPEPAATGGAARAAVLDEPGMPVSGCPAAPAVVAEILQDAGVQVQRVSAAELADRQVLCRQRFDLVVLPYGETFPSAARESLLEFLQADGDLVTLGGYAFQNLVRQVDGRWEREEEILAAKLAAATRDDQSLIANGGFEDAAEIPVGGAAFDGRWRRTGDHAVLSADNPYRGAHCARVELHDDAWVGSGGYYAAVRVTPGRQYRASGAIRATQLAGPGIAYIALYQYDAEGKFVDFRDFASIREPADWQTFEYHFVPSLRVDHVRVHFGFFQKSGVAFFDEIRLFDVTDAVSSPINTATGEPGDGLKVTPAQIGIFDPSYPLKRAVQLRAPAGQSVVQTAMQWPQPVSGWAASGVLGSDQARWIPLLEACDRYGRPRGAAGAMLLHYGGHYDGSGWIYFGVDNVDLFADRASDTARVLQQAVRFLARKVFLRNFTTDHALYRPGETVRASVQVDNRGRADAVARVVFEWETPSPLPSPAPAVVTKTVVAGHSEPFEAELGPVPPGQAAARLRVRLLLDDKPFDQLTTGVVQEDAEVLQSGPQLRFVDNYFTLNNRPLFLFGTDTYARTYQAAYENPATWLEELTAARDVGLNLYENLQYQRPGHQMRDEDWRKFRAMAQLCQAQGLVFMPGMLIGHNTAVPSERLAEESRLCAEYARQLGDVPGLLYYINGDYLLDVSQHAAAVRQDWQQFLQSQYGGIDALRQAWGRNDLPDSFDQIDYPPVNSGLWDDRARIDDVRFLMQLTTRWNASHVAAVRSVDLDHPTTSEYYARPSEGIDLPLTIDAQDVSNIGYFDLPHADLEHLPWRICFVDLRARGKGVSLGEYGVKTHPAWEESNGAWGYHIRRTETQQRQLFAAIAHYGLGLGCSKVQNWCLRDGDANVFPWGLFYPNQLVPKDVAYVHRNQSLAWRFLTPQYQPPEVLVVLANQLRLGNDGRSGEAVVNRACADLLALHVPFGCLDDDHLQHIPASTRLMIYPSPFTARDQTVAQLRAWVAQGGTLLVTGDLSYDENRQLTRADRLSELAGVRLGARQYDNLRRDTATDRPAQFTLGGTFAGAVRPCVELEDVRGDVLGRDDQGRAVLVRQPLGQGTVYYCTDPLELAPDDAAMTLRRHLYAALVRECKVAALPVEPNVPWLHVMRQPTARGAAYVVFHTESGPAAQQVALDTPAGRVQLNTRQGWPGLAVTTNAGDVVMVHTYGTAAVAGQELCRGTGQQILVALDGQDLRQSSALLLAPLESGTLALPPRDRASVALVGDFVQGKWTVAESIPLPADAWRLDIDDDRATMVILLCPADEQQRWGAHLEQALQRPDQLEGW